MCNMVKDPDPTHNPSMSPLQSSYTSQLHIFLFSYKLSTTKKPNIEPIKKINSAIGNLTLVPAEN